MIMDTNSTSGGLQRAPWWMSTCPVGSAAEPPAGTPRPGMGAPRSVLSSHNSNTPHNSLLHLKFTTVLLPALPANPGCRTAERARKSWHLCVYMYIYMKVCVTGMMKLQQKRELQRGKPRLSPGQWRVRRRRSRGNNLEGVTGDRGRVGGWSTPPYPADSSLSCSHPRR